MQDSGVRIRDSGFNLQDSSVEGRPYSALSPRSSVLKVSFGHATHAGQRERNEDCFGVVTPEGEELATKGMAFAIADGVSGHGGGREAAEYTVRGVLADYYATPETWEISYALDRVLTALNRWLHAEAHTHREFQGMASTLSMLILRGNRYWLTHAGDTRVFRLREGDLEQLTTDHVWDRADLRHVLTRGIGLDQHLVLDHSGGELRIGDIFLLASDGVWETLDGPALKKLLGQEPGKAAQELVNSAIACGSRDNATAVVVRVDELPAQKLRESLAEGRALSPLERLKPGHEIDGFKVEELLHESRETLIYKVRHIASKQALVLKTLNPRMQDDTEACEALLAEEWLTKRIVSPFFPQVPPVANRTRLYFVMTYHPGATLEAHLKHGSHFSPADASRIAMSIVKGLSALHRLHVVHRDIKPANVLLGEDKSIRILDLGVAAAAGNRRDSGNPGTPSYMAPELFLGGSACAQTDLYSAGASLYRLLTRKYPYGEIEPFQHPRFGDPVPPSRYRPDIPHWLESILLKAVARDPKHRFETAEEMLLALERGEHQPVNVPRMSLAERDPENFWRGIAIIAIVINLLLLYYIAAA
ncbi:MAG: protein kinase domain-containing protein [Burkholderiales bacterium]